MIDGEGRITYQHIGDIRPEHIHNLLKKLEEAGYVAIAKSFKDNKPLTRASITPEGRKAFAAYLDALGGLIGSQG